LEKPAWRRSLDLWGGLSEVGAGAVATLQWRTALSEGDLPAALEASRRAWKHFDAAGEFGRAGQSLWSAPMITIQGGDFEPSIADAQAAVDYSRRLHVRYSEQNGLQHIARLALQRGEFERARELVAAMAARPGTMYLKDEVEFQLVESAGDPWPPGEMPAMSLAGGVESFRLHLHGIRARMLLESGDANGCEQELQAHWDAFSEYRAGAPTAWALLHAALGWTAIERAGSAELARNWYEAYGEYPEMLHTMVGSALRFRGALALRLNLVDEAHALFSDALRICEPERAVLDLGRCCLGLAEVAQMRGQVDEAREHLERAGDVFARCGAKRFLDEVLAKKEILKA